MLQTKLEIIRDQLKRHEIRLSDALLIVARFLNKSFEQEKLVWLNRELLGYLNEDLQSVFQSGVPQESNLLPIPTYRFLEGAWGKAREDGLVIHIETPRLKEKKIFCNIGIQQIETQLAQLDSSQDNVYCMSFDPMTGAQFYCYAEELERLYNSVRDRLIRFIDASVMASK